MFSSVVSRSVAFLGAHFADWAAALPQAVATSPPRLVRAGKGEGKFERLDRSSSGRVEVCSGVRPRRGRNCFPRQAAARGSSERTERIARYPFRVDRLLVEGTEGLKYVFSFIFSFAAAMHLLTHTQSRNYTCNYSCCGASRRVLLCHLVWHGIAGPLRGCACTAAAGLPLP